MSRPPWRELQAELAEAGFRPSKALGQNFLLDANMARSLVRDAGVAPGDRVVEIGAGLGFLTAALAEAGARVRALELDRRLLAVARRTLASHPEVELFEGDALAGKHALGPALLALLPADEPYRIVANLPYAISGPLLALLARLERPPETMALLLQREVAEKAAAAPGTRDFGALAARLDLAYARRAGRAVPAALFWPRPRVASRVIHLERRPEAVAPSPARRAAFDRLVDALFQRRRKTVRSGLAALAAARGAPGGGREAAERALAAAGVDPRARPEALDTARLLALADALEAAAPPPRGPAGA